MKGLVRASAVLALVASISVAHAAGVSPDGRRLQETLDHSNVEQLWLAGVHIDWRSGKPDGRPVKSARIPTHCSAFVAAVADHLGIYLLHPPEHPLTLLANAQSDWLRGDGAAQGWKPVDDGIAAQALANQGALVVAVYRSHYDDHPGHIAIVRPSGKSLEDVQRDGPEITQAGMTNHLDTTLREGFAGHPLALSNHEIGFFAHSVDWSQAPRI